MLIRVMTIPEGSAQGAHKFARRLRAKMSERHDIILWDDPRYADVAMVRGSINSAHISQALEHSNKLILQYGGVDFSAYSKIRILDTINNASGIIYNSNFGMKTVHCHLGDLDYPKETVIPNGALRGPLTSFLKPVCLLVCDNYDLPIKARALDVALNAMPRIIDAFPDAELWILGNKPTIGPTSFPIRVLGHLDDAAMQKVRSKVSLVLHVVEDDNCPNAVVESLGQGIPVVCHNKSGVPEFARFFGMTATHFNPKGVAGKAISLLKLGSMWQDKWMKKFDETLSIEAVAKRYERFLENLI